MGGVWMKGVQKEDRNPLNFIPPIGVFLGKEQGLYWSCLLILYSMRPQGRETIILPLGNTF